MLLKEVISLHSTLIEKLPLILFLLNKPKPSSANQANWSTYWYNSIWRFLTPLRSLRSDNYIFTLQNWYI